MFQRLVSRVLLALLFMNTVALAPMGPMHTRALADPIVTGSKPFTFIPGTVISSSQVNADFDYIINQVNTNAAKNGANSSITALLGLTTPLAPSMGGSSVYYATTVGGTVDAITVTATTPAISSFSLVAGVSIIFTPTGTNTVSGPTLNVNGTGAVALQRNSTGTGGSFNIRPGELSTPGSVWAVYDGARWTILNAPPPLSGSVTIASAATTDLGIVGSRNVEISGTTNITSFGTTANLNLPLYLVKFSGVLTVVHDGSAIILPGIASYTTSAGDAMWVEFVGTGWRVREIMPRNPTYSIGGVNGLTIQNNAGTPTTQIDVAWTGKAVLENTTNSSFVIPAGGCTINAATTGVNGLDTGSLANNTWYYIYIIASGFGAGTGCLMSTSATAPTMPGGITYKYRIGAQRTGGAATFNRVIQKGNRARYVVVAGSVTPALPTIGSGTSGNVATPTWTSVGTGNFVPTTATNIVVHISATTGASIVQVAPNNGYGAYNSTTNPPYTAIGLTSSGNSTNAILVDMLLESANIFWASNTANGLFMASGWTDAVNAN